ncbi:DsbE family thiol:disulfide interchange protein [uncultured Endozoicomonas sp.]|uniref:DsbE family thiol:disulfide interchange protein n=1 Tax=uncultured Endozoicomonas sp. TaxID=432652 RepID=UPI00260FDDB3|nr:DsbE family thiol:disulfide interchange protein [uncultured Endozoicomonas sp.]
MNRRLKLFLPLAIFLSLCLMFYIALFRDNKGELPSALLDSPLPSFSLTTVKNPARTVTRDDLLGEVALLNVWATWCPACRVEHPYLVDLANKGVPIYGVNYKDDQPEARKWLKVLHDPYRFSINDQDGSLGINLGVYGAPETYLIDHQGMIRYKHVGIVDANVWKNDIEPKYRALVEQAQQSNSGENSSEADPS